MEIVDVRRTININGLMAETKHMSKSNRRRVTFIKVVQIKRQCAWAQFLLINMYYATETQRKGK
jgi:hypothetical protein